MDREISEESTQIAVGCEKALHIGKSNEPSSSTNYSTKADEKHHSENTIISSTPEKTLQPPRRIKSKGYVFPVSHEKTKSKNFTDVAVIDQLSAEIPKFAADEDVCVSIASESQVANKTSEDRETGLPEKYRILAEFFYKMVTSVRLLNLREKICSFQNISSMVEVLTRRKFMYSHLRQIIYVFADAIQIEKILVHDEKGLCMKPGLKIGLLLEVVEPCQHTDQSKHMVLCQAFLARLAEFIDSHHEDCNIPEATLPEPFGPMNNAVPTSRLVMQLSTELPQSNSDGRLHLSSPSHLSTSFRKQFSQKKSTAKIQKELLMSPLSFVSIETTEENNREITLSQKDISCSISSSNTTPSELLSTPNCCTVTHLSESTPVKLVSYPNKMMIETPAQQTTKRPNMASPDEKLASDFKLQGHSARRSLIYLPTKSDGSVDSSTCNTEQNEITFYASHQTRAATRFPVEEELGRNAANGQQMLDDNAAGIVHNYAMDTSDLPKRQQMLSIMPDLFNTICFIFRSIKCSLITKKELMHKILSYNLDIEETSEVEEQLQLLEELVPDWFCRKTVSSGDFLYFIANSYDPELVRLKLLEAVSNY